MTRCIICNSDFPVSLASCPICGFVPDASKLEDPKADPNIPDLREYWCRACRGHHGTFLSGVGDDRTRKCKDCSSGDVHLVNFNITKPKFHYSIEEFVFCAFILLCFILSTIIGHVALSLLFISLFVFSVFLSRFRVRYRYKTELAVRNEWLDWAKERGFDENAENK
jgi:hypothetical protein